MAIILKQDEGSSCPMNSVKILVSTHAQFLLYWFVYASDIKWQKTDICICAKIPLYWPTFFKWSLCRINFVPHYFLMCSNLSTTTIADVYIQNISCYVVVNELRSTYYIPESFYSSNKYRSRSFNPRFEQEDNMSINNSLV